MSTETLELNPGAQVESIPLASPHVKIELIYGSDDPKKGFNIPTGKITKLEIKENFFTKLPQMHLVIGDDGYLFHQYGFQIGNMFSVKITPLLQDEDMLPEPYVDAQFKIESIDYSLDSDRQIYIYTFNCMYLAEKYVNDICIWPQNDVDIYHLDKEYTSKDVLSRIVTQGGLKFSDDYAGNTGDNMAWLNSSLTYCEFADKILKHAWVGEEDIPLLFVDKNGTAHFNTLNSLCKEQGIKAHYMNATLYQKKYEEPNESNKSTQKPTGVRLYTDITFKNIGYIQNQGAYGIKATLFNPYNIKELNPIAFPVTDVNILNPKAVTLNDSCIRTKEYHDNKSRLAAIGNKSGGQTQNTRYSYSGMHFKQTHEYYDYAPLHYETIKRAFYQQFVFISIDVLNQPGFDSNPTQRINLGDKISIDTTMLGSYTDSIQSNTYIVCGLRHIFSTGGKYTVLIIAVSDGIGGIGVLKKESNLNK